MSYGSLGVAVTVQLDPAYHKGAYPIFSKGQALPTIRQDLGH